MLVNQIHIHINFFFYVYSSKVCKSYADKADKAGRGGGGQMLTLAPAGRNGGLANADIA